MCIYGQKTGPRIGSQNGPKIRQNRPTLVQTTVMQLFGFKNKPAILVFKKI
jgi:hypothetical protein